MQSVDKLLASYNLNASDIQRIAIEAKASSVDCGEKGVSRGLLQPTWNLLDDISDEIWYSEIEIADKISLGFQLYERFPSYYHFLVPFYHGVRNREIILPEHKETIWKHFIRYLALEDCYADPVSYVLWVEFFEDATTVRDTWQGLLKNCHNEKIFITILEIAGPVPFDLKEERYNLLIADKTNHEAIFNSLFCSAFEYYGNIDEDKASVILNRLDMDRRTDKYKLLEDKLSHKL